MRKWLVIVQRDRPDLYRFLQERLRGVPSVEVVLDGRRGDRRSRRVTMDGERRLRERRQAPSMRAREHWRALGFRLVPAPGANGSVRAQEAGRATDV